MMTDTRDLTGGVALVTGGNRGIGRAVALALAEAGADIEGALGAVTILVNNAGIARRQTLE